MFSGRGGDLRVSELANTVCSLRNADEWDNVPVAIVLTKADRPGITERLARALGMGGDCLRPVPENDKDGNPYRGFARDEFVPVNTRLRRLLRDQLVDVDTRFKTRAYFAVSAISQGVVDRVEMHGNMYNLDPMDAESLRRTKEWMQDWDGRSEEDRLYILGDRLANNGGVECPYVSRGDGSAIAFETAHKSDFYNDVTTNIEVTFAGGHSIKLTLGDIRRLTLQSVPRGSSSLRIEEPFRWLLWRLGIIQEPKPKLEEPHRPFGCTQRRWNRLLRELEARNSLAIEQFYACEEVLES
jgi:hypothetical protein